MNFPYDRARQLVKLALEEDIASGDVSALWTIPSERVSEAELRSKAEGVLAGMPFIEIVCEEVDSSIKVELFYQDGQTVQNGDVIAKLKGPSQSLLGAERTFLNFLQHLSGVATQTQQYVNQISSESSTQILDTRKTLPGFRLLQKYAVAMGGGTNHRIGLYDMVMLKENHIEAAGGIALALEKVFDQKPHDMKVEVEVENLDQITEALEYPIHQIMLDNMDNELTREAVALIRAKSVDVKIEASGNMTLERIHSVSLTGVDYISVGALTHSVTAFDISLRFV